ncbi:MAG: S1 family peptidase [Myxococcota bacterium]
MLVFRLDRTSLVLFTSVMAFACGEAPPPELEPEDAVATKASQIQGGVEDMNDPAVVGIFSGHGLCSGSLIAPNLVLTAQHCVAEISSAAVDCKTSTFGDVNFVGSISVTTQWDGLAQMYSGEYVKLYYASDVMIPPGQDEVCGRDVALILLSKSIPPTEALPLNPRVDIDVVGDEEYRAVGFGNTSAYGGGAGVRRVRDELFIKCAGDCNTSSIVENMEWIGDTGICSGDSGGPALDMMNRVIGVVSRGASWGSTCAMPVYGSVYGWGDWIKEQALVAAKAGGYDPAPWVTGGSTVPETDAGALVPEGGVDGGADVETVPEGGVLGEICESDSDCSTSRCATNVVPGYCTVGCSSLAPACPSGMVCNAEAGQCQKPGTTPQCTGDAGCEAGADGTDEAQVTGGCSVSSVPVGTTGFGWLALAVLFGLRRRR